MTPEETILAAVEAWVGAFNSADLDRLGAAYAPDSEYVIAPRGWHSRGPDEHRRLAQQVLDAQPDRKMTVHRRAATGDTVMVELSVEGTPAAATPDSQLASVTHRMDVCTVLVFRDGLIAYERDYVDTAPAGAATT